MKKHEQEKIYVDYRIEENVMTMIGSSFMKLFRQKQYAQTEELKELPGYDKELDKYFYADVPLAYIFRELISKLGRIPTQREFIKEASKRVFREWVRKSQYYGTNNNNGIYQHLLNDQIMENTVQNRIKRTYMGFVAEWNLLAIIKSKFNDVIIMRNPYVDVRMGIDFFVVFVNEGKVINIHSTSSSAKSKSYLNKKSECSENGFVGDLMFYYSSTKNTKESRLINGFPIYNEDFVTTTIKEALNEPSIGSAFIGSKLQEYMAALKFKYSWDNYMSSSWEIYRCMDIAEENREKYEKTMLFFLNYAKRVEIDRKFYEDQKDSAA